VIIGGGISANETFMDELNKEITNIQKSHNSIVDLDLPKVVPAKLKNDAGMVGAVYQLVQSETKHE